MKYEGDWWSGGFLVGFIIGFILGFAYTRLAPTPPAPTPAHLVQIDKAIYITLIAAAYHHDGNFEKAQHRLSQLADPNIAQTIITLAETYINSNADLRDIRALSTLATKLGANEAHLLAYLSTPAFTPTIMPRLSPTASSTPVPTLLPTSPPTVSIGPQTTSGNPTNPLRLTSTPRRNSPFELAQSVALCDNTADGVLRVYVRDKDGQGIAGVEVVVSWPSGQDRFFTGLKSRTNPGYADFQMSPEQTYQVELPSVSADVVYDVNQAATTRCPNMPMQTHPSWQLVFQQRADGLP